jgi:valyl-tRNA synthetase
VAIADTNTAFKDYQFQQCTTAIYNFWLYDLCDVYLEATKRVFYKVDSLHQF